MFAVPAVFVLSCLGLPCSLTALQNKSLYIQIETKMAAVHIIMYDSYYRLFRAFIYALVHSYEMTVR